MAACHCLPHLASLALCVAAPAAAAAQVRLCLAKKDYIRAQILARKISPRAFQKQQGDSKGEIGIEGTAIEEADKVGGHQGLVKRGWVVVPELWGRQLGIKVLGNTSLSQSTQQCECSVRLSVGSSSLVRSAGQEA
jgi:hypothetical protein